MARHPRSTGRGSTRSIFGCANQAGEDNRNVARMALLLAGLPDAIPGVTVNRLCGSGLDAVGVAARAIRAGESDVGDRGRRREHDAGAVRDGQGRRRFSRAVRDLRHDARLALRQSADASSTTASIRWRRPAENVAEECQVARERPGRVRAAQPAAMRARHRRPAVFARRDRAGRGAGRASRPGRGGPRTSIRAPDTTLEALAQAQAVRAHGRHGHGRQCVGHQRRRRGADRRVGSRPRRRMA